MRADALTRALSGSWHGRYGMARCPAHHDGTPSLSIKEGEGGRLLLLSRGLRFSRPCKIRRDFGASPRRSQQTGSVAPQPICRLKSGKVDRGNHEGYRHGRSPHGHRRRCASIHDFGTLVATGYRRCWRALSMFAAGLSA
jgi:hypothetical protein